jgi:hypothetical protein
VNASFVRPGFLCWISPLLCTPRAHFFPPAPPRRSPSPPQGAGAEAARRKAHKKVDELHQAAKAEL